MPRADGPLTLTVRHPLPGDPPPASGRDYVMGSAGNGDAVVLVNGDRVTVSANGAFLAYVRAPAAGASYQVSARLGDDSARAQVPVGSAPAATDPAIMAGSGRVTRGNVVFVPADSTPGVTSEIPARAEPEGDYVWSLLPGTRGVVTEVRGPLRRVRLDPSSSVWVDARLLRAAPPRAYRALVRPMVRTEVRDGETDVILPTPGPLPYRLRAGDDGLTFSIPGASTGGLAGPASPARSHIARLSVGTAMGLPGTEVMIRAQLRGALFGYEVFWRRGAMVLRVRHPPAIDATRPMAGLTIVVDAGHPPGGAVGPTGLREPDVALDVARRVETLLAARGAHVVLTRRDTASTSLDRRVAIARTVGGHAFVSIHADAIASGAHPARDIGTAIYYNREQSLRLAGATRLQLVGRLGLQDRGALHGDYAVIRQTWMPSILCEGATMTVPVQEAALADPSFRAAYAMGIADGLEVYFRGMQPYAARP